MFKIDTLVVLSFLLEAIPVTWTTLTWPPDAANLTEKDSTAQFLQISDHRRMPCSARRESFNKLYLLQRTGVLPQGRQTGSLNPHA
jgi:hypothetical protein